MSVRYLSKYLISMLQSIFKSTKTKFQDHATSPSARISDVEPETPSSVATSATGGARRGRGRNALAQGGPDPLTSSPGRDLPPFEDEGDGDLLGEGRDEEEEEDDGENLFGDDMERDYRAMPGLDRYDTAVLDEDDYDAMSEGDRAAAEAQMRRRDRDEGRAAGGRGLRRGLIYDSDDDDDEPRARRRRLAERAAEGEEGMDVDEGGVESIENLEDTRGRPVREYVTQIGPRTECANRFKNFLKTYLDAKGRNLYKEKIRHMCERKHKSSSWPCNMIAKFLFALILQRICLVSRLTTTHWPRNARCWPTSCPRPPLRCCRSLTRPPSPWCWACFRSTSASPERSTCASPTCRWWRSSARCGSST